jgi:trans-aconitate 2-methyltransferase
MPYLETSRRPFPTAQWNAADYAAHSAVQQSWARELIARLKLQGDEHVLDVGCGDGKVTAELARALPSGSATGVDASRQMITFAKKAFPARQHSPLAFHVGDARRLRFTNKFDVIFSNATLHWVDDHQAFLRGAAAALKPGGRLLVSCGGRGNAHEVFLALRSEMRLARWRQCFRRMPRPYFFHAPGDYEKWLPRFGFRSCHIELAPKDAVYPDAEGLAAWLRTTWLPYTQRVPGNLREEFIAAVTERYLTKHPADKAGQVHVRMVRLEIDAVKI